MNNFEKCFPIILEIALKSALFNIEPLSVEDAPKKLHDTVNKALKKCMGVKLLQKLEQMKQEI